MAVLYFLVINDPNKVGAYPPSVLGSTWFKTIAAYQAKYGGGSESDLNYIWFKDDATANTWLEENKLTDATLLADIAAWKSAHNITYNNYFYNLPNDTNITQPGIVT